MVEIDYFGDFNVDQSKNCKVRCIVFVSGFSLSGKAARFCLFTSIKMYSVDYADRMLTCLRNICTVRYTTKGRYRSSRNATTHPSGLVSAVTAILSL